jgi:transposase InsO family protein
MAERARELVAAALGLRERQPTWGPKKLRRKLAERWPDLSAPARSTIGDWLRKEGLTQSRRPRRRCPPFASPFQTVAAPNAVWRADFKGWFKTGEGKRCDPLTISDAMSRYLLRCEAVASPDGDCVRAVFEAAFCEFGLPLAIRSDNGPPFASVGAGGLSRLSLWWIKLGVRPERIDPGKPQQNGRHERLHRTLKEDAASPPAATLAEQQRAFDAFRAVYNNERPHEALDFATPASLYCASPRAYPCALREPDYPDEAAVRRVRTNGCIKWAGDLVFVSEALIGEPVAVEETEAGEPRVRYADVELGFIDKSGRLRRRKLTKPRPACGLVDNAGRCPRGHRRDCTNSNRPPKWPKVSAMYPLRCVNDRSGCTGFARRSQPSADVLASPAGGAERHRRDDDQPSCQVLEEGVGVQDIESVADQRQEQHAGH